MRALSTLIFVLICGLANAQEFKPYPQAKVTPEQWQAYFDDVSTRHASTRQDAPNAPFVGFSNAATQTMYSFTKPGHPAHPAWITRQVVQQGTSIQVQQIGFFAGEEAPFAQLYQQFQKLNDRMREDIKRGGR
jgi:hypothetical protein